MVWMSRDWGVEEWHWWQSTGQSGTVAHGDSGKKKEMAEEGQTAGQGSTGSVQTVKAAPCVRSIYSQSG